MDTLTVAQNILQQLGGYKFIVMTGAKNICGDKDFLLFHIGKNAAGYKAVKIILTPMDDYTMQFIKQGNKPAYTVTIKSVDGVYADNLTEIFRNETGLETSL